MKIKLSYLSAIISLILISNTSSFCQLVQPSNFLSASLNFDSQKNESAVHDHINNKTKALNIYSSISWGHYINQKWAVGLTAGIEYNYQKTERDGFEQYDDVTQGRILSFGILVRRNKSLAENWNFFSQLNMGMGFGKYNISSEGSTLTNYSSKLYNASLGLGINFQFHKHWAVELVPVTFGYRSLNQPATEYNSSSETSSGFYINSFTTGLSVSFNYLFN